MSRISSFPPVARPDALICILGSMPGEASLRASRYYAHPRNAFWGILEEILGIARSLSYEERLESLKACRVSLWDVVNSCIRKTSLDSDIESRSIVPNDFASFFTQHPLIKTLFFNGGKAETVYRKVVLPGLSEPLRGLRLIRLPSTSPAYAGMTFENKRKHWRRIKWALEENASQGYYHDQEFFHSNGDSRVSPVCPLSGGDVGRSHDPRDRKHTKEGL